MTNIINSFKKYKTSKQKNHQKKYSIKKFNNFKRKGGAINVPIYLSIPEEDKCPDLKTLNTDITNLKTPTNEEDLVKLRDKLVLTVPLHNFKEIIYSEYIYNIITL